MASVFTCAISLCGAGAGLSLLPKDPPCGGLSRDEAFSSISREWCHTAGACEPPSAGLPAVPLLLPCSTRRWASASSQLHLGRGSSGTGSSLQREQRTGEV